MTDRAPRRPRRGRCLLALLLALAGAGWPPVARAAAPFTTDNAEPTDAGHYEFYLAGEYSARKGMVTGALPSAEADYGAAPFLQLHVMAPLAFSRMSGGPTQFGYGDTEIGAKLRLVPAGEGILHPAVAVFPLIDFPTGDAARGLGTGRTHAFLPVWLDQGIGPWSLFGGGGYWINPGPGNRNWWFAGAGATRKATDQLTLGGELFHTSPSLVGLPPSTAFNLGGIYDITDHHHLLFSAGRGVQNPSRTNRFTTYVAYELTF